MADQINALIEHQIALVERMKSFITNYKKDGKERRTRTYYEKRLETFQRTFQEFENGHLAILKTKNTEKTFKTSECAYFSDDIFGKLEDFFLDNFEIINERFKKEFPNGNSVGISDKHIEKDSEANDSNNAQVKLPKLALEKFDGDYRKWPTFRDLFQTLVHNNRSLAPVQKLQYLKLHLINEPEHLIRHFQITDNNYEAAWEDLKERYDNKRVLVHNELKVLFDQRILIVETTEAIKGLLDTTTECLQALNNLEVDTQNWDPIIVFLTVQKLPQEAHQLWEQEISKGKTLPSWKQLKEFLTARFRALEAISTKNTINKRENKSSNYTNRTSSQSFFSTSRARCVLCSGEHNIRKCPRFSSLDVSQRLQTVKGRGLCINCLGSGHLLATCPSKQKCFHCQQNHHSLLHRKATNYANHTDRPQQGNLQDIVTHHSIPVPHYLISPTNEASFTLSSNHSGGKHKIPIAGVITESLSSANVNSFIANQPTSEQILLATALVKVVSFNGQEQVVRALIDQGSQASFVTEAVVQNLKIRKEPIAATVRGLGQASVGQVTAAAQLIIKPMSSNTEIKVSGLIMKKLSNLLPAKIIHNKNWSHIQGLHLADPEFYKPAKIDVLLGADVYGQIIMDGLIKGLHDSPIAQKTIFGWIISGQISNIPRNEINLSNFHIYSELTRQLKRFWELEEVSTEKIHSEEEMKCEEHFKRTHKRRQDGKYEVDLPLKEVSEQSYLGRSRKGALAALFQMENRFRKKPSLKVDYVNCLEEYVSLNHIKEVPSYENDNTKEHTTKIYETHCYLPHHAVVKESSTTTKLRVVFNASKETQSGYSLNDIMLKGPVIQDELAKILMRWRKHRVVITADIEKMYRQIWVKDEHTELQRIVWRKEHQLPIKDFKLLTVTFGTKSAPFLATRVLQQLALDEQTNYPEASKITLSDFYVDDLLSGADSVEQCRLLQSELMQLLRSGGFSLRKWNSNSSEVLNYIPEELKEGSTPRNFDELNHVKTLGTYWNPQTDNFSFSITFGTIPMKWTKRSIFSEIAKLFDPLGLLAPSIILAKLMIQKIWLSGLNWDEEISEELKHDWVTYREKLQKCDQIEINRWLQYTETESTFEIHGFSDASIKAYAAAVYLCVTHPDGTKTTNLITAKSKVAPIKTISLPRLELCGAHLLAKLTRYVLGALKLKGPVTLTCWTDSQIVLAWLKEHPSKWTSFVANRVSQIHELLDDCHWYHTPSSNNPADCATRGMYPEDLIEHKLWWQGPDWLLKGREFWPKIKEHINTGLELRKINSHHVDVKGELLLEARFSSLTKLLRVTAYIKRFTENCKKPKGNRDTNYLKAEEIEKATEIWIKITQQEHFSNEIGKLSNNQQVERNSKILKLHPFIGQDGLLRVGGRLRHANIPFSEKFPIILPDKANFTTLLIEKTHLDTLHGGPQLMMTVIGKKFWILNARNTIRYVIHKCLPCFKHKANCQTQLMGDLPIRRINVSRPFSYTGIDYCGPFELKTHKGKNPKKYKAYIAVFICMATKAMHLELVTDLSAEGFIAAFRRFSSRRGLSLEIYCDCGTNFVGATKILAKQQCEMIQQLNIDIASLVEKEGVTFKFIPPASPHFGGLWEAGVRSTKFHLRRVLSNILLTYEEFSTVLAQIEACLNSRPITELSSDPRDLNPLTPAHFLIGDILLTPPEPCLDHIKITRLDRWQFLQRTYQSFWKRWNSEYLCRLQQRPKWVKRSGNVKIGELVIIKEENLPPCRWVLGRIIEVHPGPDSLVRVVTLQTKDRVMKRPITKICLLPNQENQENDKQ